MSTFQHLTNYVALIGAAIILVEYQKEVNVAAYIIENNDKFSFININEGEPNYEQHESFTESRFPHHQRHRQKHRQRRHRPLNALDFWNFVSNSTEKYEPYIEPNIVLHTLPPGRRSIPSQKTTLKFNPEETSERVILVEVAEGEHPPVVLDEPVLEIVDDLDAVEDDWSRKLRIIDAPDIDYGDEAMMKIKSSRRTKSIITTETIRENNFSNGTTTEGSITPKDTNKQKQITKLSSSTESDDYENKEHPREQIDHNKTIFKNNGENNNKFAKIANNNMTSKGDMHSSAQTVENSSSEFMKRRNKQGAIQELKLHDDPAEAANQCDEQWWKSKRRRVRPKNSDNGEGSAIFPNPTSEMVQQQEKLNYEYTQQQSTEKSSQLVTKEALTLRGPKGDRGEQGSPGVCLQQCESGLPGSPGPPGPTGPKGSQGDPGMPGIGKPGIFNDLSEKDIARIASWPGIKGEKGECITDRSDYTRYTIEGNTINTKHELKGKKGDMGIMGPPGRDGLPGQSIPPGLSGPTNSSGIYTPSNLPRANQLTTLQNDNSYKVAIGSMRIFQTTVELLAENLPAGSLAFSVSSQQLYLAVKNGWRQIMLGPFHPNVVQRPSSFIHVDSKVQTAGQDHLSYWLVQNDDEENNKNKTPLSANASNYNYKEMNGKSCVFNSATFKSKDKLKKFQQANSIITNNLEIETLIKPPKDEQLSPKNIERFSHSGPILYKTTRDTSSNVPNGFNANTSIKRADHVLHLIALNELVDGNFHGIRGADLACYSEARRTGYTTTFRAFISSRVQDLNKIVHPADRHFTPVVNLHGERVANSFDSLFDDSAHSHVLLHSFNGQNIYDDSYGSIGKRSLWHGSTNKGTRALGKFCNDWRSANPEMFGMASPLMRNRALTHMAAPKSCDKKFVVLCIENMSKYESKLRFGQRI